MFLLLLSACLVLFIFYYKWTCRYWLRKDVPYFSSKNTFGSIINAFRREENIVFTIRSVYRAMKQNGWKHCGVNYLMKPIYIVIDLNYVRNIMMKDFHHFVDHNLYLNEESDPLSAHIFSITGAKWRNFRAKITPSFTINKMKGMLPIVVDCSLKMKGEIREIVEMKDLAERFTVEAIGACVFGLECKMFEEENPPLLQFNRKLGVINTWQRIKESFLNQYQEFSRLLGLRFFPKDASVFYSKILKKCVNFRETNGRHDDLLQTLIDLNTNNEASFNEIAGHFLMFLNAGFVTFSAHIAFTMYELSKNFDIQKKLRDEIKRVLAQYGGKITYEALQEMKYSNQVIQESLRKYPPLPSTNRKCVKDYKLPDQDIIIEEGTPVIIPILGIHHDEEYYPDPEKFDPERFSDEGNKLRPNFAFLPFGKGPRMCIGMRFALMKAKVALIALLENHEFTLNEKTDVPLKMEVNAVTLSPENGIWLNVKRI